MTPPSPPRPNLKEIRPQVKCADCKGTGAENPDCEVCHGYRDIKLRRAYALGYKKDELEIEEDGWCRCPRCGGDLCGNCMGDGYVYAEVARQQMVRVLLCGYTGEIPPLIYTDYRGTVRRDANAYLSRSAAAEARERGYIHWFCTFMGDEISLTRAGEAALRAQLSMTQYQGMTARAMRGNAE